MLLPILILQLDVKKFLDNLANLKTLTGWISNFTYTIITQLHYFSVTETYPIKLHYLPSWLQQNLNEQYTSKYLYVFASHIQKHQQSFQEMTPPERQRFWEQLKSDYSQVLIYYFTTEKTLQEKIDKFINAIFYANIPVPQIIEIHMEVIEEFSKQLKLEGRSDETLLDYRLTLIDILAHLCEVYRCSIYK